MVTKASQYLPDPLVDEKRFVTRFAANQTKRMKKVAVEFIGTFFLVFAVLSAAVSGIPPEFGPVAVGAVLTAVIYAGGHVSKAHYNPAVTIAFFLRGKIRASEILPFIGAQLIAALLGALLVGLVYPGAQIEAASISTGPSLIAETVFTFALVFVILNVALDKRIEGNQFYGIAIGLIVVGGAYTVGSVSSAVFNPAVAFGSMLNGILPWGALWIYLVANLSGAIAAAICFQYVGED